jgi:hypothetical protein
MQLEMGEFFESINDALKAMVMALGGYKKVGGTLRPELPLAQAEAWVRHCLDESRREKFDPGQVMLLLRESRKAGFHAGMDFVCADAGYEKAKPADLEAQVQSIEQQLAATMERLNAQVSKLGQLKERLGQQ